MKLHENTEFIEKLFFQQIKGQTLKSNETIDFQFSDLWFEQRM